MSLKLVINYQRSNKLNPHDGTKNERVLMVNVGCGSTPTQDWLNFDNSPALKLAKSPFRCWLAKSLGLLSRSQIENIEWNKKHSILFADATKCLPLKSSSVNCIYTSHMVEHLSTQGVNQFLVESLRVLDNDGILRVSVPDLRKAVDEYILDSDADNFMTSLLVTAPPINTLKEKLNVIFSGYRHHQWMYDGKSLSKLMSDCGFRNVTIQEPGTTNIENAAGLDLYERSDISLYVEGQK